MNATMKIGSAAAIAALALSSGCTMMQNTMNPGGGQQISLSGASEVPPVTSGAAGN